jgi:hypothetical protein
MEAKLEAKMDGLKEEILEVLKNLITETTPKSENVSHEIHDEDTRKVNQEWRNSNLGLKTNHVPKINKIPVQTILPELNEEGKIILEPESITDTRIHQLRNRSIS